MGFVLCGALGCDSGASTEGGGGTGGDGGAGGGVVCPGDPLEGPIPEDCGVWVSAGQGDDANEGTQSAPVASLTHAIELASQGKGRVYACGETWTEALTVPSGVSLHGGFDCEDGWKYTGEARRAMLVPPTPLAIKWGDVDSEEQVYLTEFYVEAPAATEPGASSIGILVIPTLPLKILRCEIVAGDGADGADGAPGDADDQPAAAGAPGNDGGGACSAPVSAGGVSPESACEAGLSKGGEGGDGGVFQAESGAPGEPAGPGGAGGLGEETAPACTVGAPGADGAHGENGAGGTGKGYGLMTADGIVGYPGQDAQPGMPGQGGGGGGATFGNTATCGAASPGGAAGGSGGAGGCGGKGGRGGQAGGSSVAVANLGKGEDLVMDYTVLQAGNGGHGGNGGAPQPSGAGGLGGKGGAGAGTIQPGCNGGNGGMGGKGGYGGGGSGGSSAAIGTASGMGPFFQMHLQYSHGKEGLGGMGDPAHAKWYGREGIANPMVNFDK